MTAEDKIHRAVLDYLRLALPGALIWHTPNGGARQLHTGARLKALGTLAGMPDLFILHGGRLHAMEIKTDRGRLSASQKAVRNALIECGASYGEARSIDDAARLLRHWGLPVLPVQTCAEVRS